MLSVITMETLVLFVHDLGNQLGYVRFDAGEHQP